MYLRRHGEHRLMHCVIDGQVSDLPTSVTCPAGKKRDFPFILSLFAYNFIKVQGNASHLRLHRCSMCHSAMHPDDPLITHRDEDSACMFLLYVREHQRVAWNVAGDGVDDDEDEVDD